MGREKRDWLRQFGRFANGVSSPDGIANVIARLTPKGFGACCRRWTLAVAGAPGGEIMALDGKTARGSPDRWRGRRPLHLVSTWACRNRLVLGQEATEEKSNELTAIPKLRAMLERQGTMVTLDARGCQRASAAHLVAQGGDEVLGLTGHQRALRERVEDFFQVALGAGCAHDAHAEIDQDQGRLAVRRYWNYGGLAHPARPPVGGPAPHRHGRAAVPRRHHRRNPGATLCHQRDPRSSPALRRRRARSLGRGKPTTLAPRRPV